MKKKQPQVPLVKSITTQLKKTVKQNTTEATTKEEIIERKKDALDIIDTAMKQIKQSLCNGNMQLDSTSDFERMVKLMLLLSGEADSRSGNSLNEDEVTQTTNINIDTVEEALNPKDEDVQAVYQKLLHAFNKTNDTE